MCVMCLGKNFILFSQIVKISSQIVFSQVPNVLCYLMVYSSGDSSSSSSESSDTELHAKKEVDESGVAGADSSSEDESSEDGEEASEEVVGGAGEDDGVWTNPSTSVIIESVMKKSADEVILMKAGANKIETYSLRDEVQRNAIIVYISDPEPGSKWKLWPFPGGVNTESLDSTSKMKQAAATMAKKEGFFEKLGGAKKSKTSPSKKTMDENESKESCAPKKKKHKKRKANKQNTDAVSDAGASEKGKHGKTQELMEDDDSVGDCFNGADLAESLASDAKSRKDSQPFEIHVSKVFEDPDMKTATVVALYDPASVWYEKAEHISTVITHLYKKKNMGKDIPSWMGTFKNITIRAEKHGLSSLYKRRSNNTTIQYVMFVFKVPLESKDSIFEDLANSVHKHLRPPFLKRKRNTAGQLTLSYVDKLPKGLKGGLQGFCLSKGAGDRDAAAAKMTEELNDFYAGGASYVYGCSLDKFMVDYDMKMFAMETLGVESWDAMLEEWKSIFFKNYPSRALPKWDQIMEQAYS